MELEGSIINQIEISGFENEKEANKFRKKLKSLKSTFTLDKVDSSLTFRAKEASWKIKEDFSLLFLFITDDEYPLSQIKLLSKKMKEFVISYLIIAPAQKGYMMNSQFLNGKVLLKQEITGKTVEMLGDLIQGGFL